MNKLRLLMLAVCCVLGGACVNTNKPVSVQKCSLSGSCSDETNADAAVKDARDTGGPDESPTSPPDVVVPSLPDGPGAELATRLDDAAGDNVPTEPPKEAGTEGAPEPGLEPGPVSELAPELAPEPASELASEPAPEPVPVSELAPELAPEPTPVSEPAVEPVPEPAPAPDPGPEPSPDGGIMGSCPTGGICDDFEDGNYSANPAWTAPGGFAVVTDGSKVLAYTGTASPAVALLGNRATALTIKARVKATVFGGNSNSYRVGLFARADSQGTPSAWYSLTITGDGSLRVQATDSTPTGCNAVTGAAVANTWYILTLVVGGTGAATTLQGTLSDDTGGNVRTIGPCNVTGGLAAGWAGAGIRGGGTHGEFDDVQVTGITP